MQSAVLSHTAVSAHHPGVAGTYTLYGKKKPPIFNEIWPRSKHDVSLFYSSRIPTASCNATDNPRGLSW